jgi:hypothetical protein
MNKAQNLNTNNWNDLFVEFGFKLAAAHANHHVKLVPFADQSLPYFSRLPDASKKLIVGSMMESVAVFEEMNSENESIIDSGKLLWRSLKRADSTSSLKFYTLRTAAWANAWNYWTRFASRITVFDEAIDIIHTPTRA